MPVAQGLHGRVTYIDSRKGGPRQAAWTGQAEAKAWVLASSGRNGTFAVPVTITMGTAANSRKWGKPVPILNRENLNGTAVSRTVHSCFVQFRWDGAECMEQTPKEMKENLFKKGHELFLILHSNCNFQCKISSYHQTGWGLKAKMRSVIKNTVSVIQYKT